MILTLFVVVKMWSLSLALPWFAADGCNSAETR